MNISNYEMGRHIDTMLPVSNVLKHTITFLEKCGWLIEIDEEVIEIPKGAELVVRSRAFIKADLNDVFLGDHLEAVILLGKEDIGDKVCAKFGVLKLYFDLDGQFITEDRYNKFK